MGKGKIRYVGLSEVGPEWLRRAHAVHPVTCVQQEWSLLTRIHEDTLLPTCKELGVGVVAYSPLARNILANPDVEVPPEDDWRKNQPRYSPDNLAKNRDMAAKTSAIAAEKGKTGAQLSLAWLYHQAKTL